MKKRDEPIKQEGRAAKKEARISDTVVLREGNISLILDSYDDIFSDFDPRGYPERALSDDFLRECIKSSADKEGNIELRLLVPKSKRNVADEIKIKKRLKDHFVKHFKEWNQERKSVILEGCMWFILGIVLITLATMIFDTEKVLFKVLFVIFEPAGWFTIWNGLDKIFFGRKVHKTEYDFYKKMVDAKVYFYEY